MAQIGTWSLNDLNLKDLIKIAVKPRTLQKVRKVEEALFY